MRHAAVILAVAALLLAGVAAGSAAYLGAKTGADEAPAAAQQHHGHAMPPKAGRPAPFRTVEQLAAEIGCAATSNLKGADYRQARCPDLILLNFDSAEGQRAWLDASQSYGGVYLVGDRWALSSNSPERIESLQATLGGTIEHPATH